MYYMSTIKIFSFISLCLTLFNTLITRVYQNMLLFPLKYACTNALKKVKICLE